MKTFILTVLGASTANALSFLIYQGFVKSKWGRNCREEVTRFFDRLAKRFKNEK